MAGMQGRTVFITGASRGIGRAIALRCARDGANVVITAKTATPHPKLPGTIHEVAKEVEAAGGKALAIQLDVRDEAAIAPAVQQAAAHFGGIDILVNNASAIQMTGTLETHAKPFDLMFGVNVRGTFLCSQACIPFLTKAKNPHILNLAPPLNMKSKWFQGHVAYTMAKYGMSMCVLGMAEEFRPQGVAVNSLWPRTTIPTAAIAVNFPESYWIGRLRSFTSKSSGPLYSSICRSVVRYSIVSIFKWRQIPWCTFIFIFHNHKKIYSLKPKLCVTLALSMRYKSIRSILKA